MAKFMLGLALLVCPAYSSETFRVQIVGAASCYQTVFWVSPDRGGTAFSLEDESDLTEFESPEGSCLVTIDSSKIEFRRVVKLRVESSNEDKAWDRVEMIRLLDNEKLIFHIGRDALPGGTVWFWAATQRLASGDVSLKNINPPVRCHFPFKKNGLNYGNCNHFGTTQYAKKCCSTFGDLTR